MDVFLYPVEATSNDIILSDPTTLIQQVPSAPTINAGGGGYRSLGSYYHEDDETATIDDQEVFQIIKAFLIVSRH